MKRFQEKVSWIFKDLLPFSNCTALITAVTKGGSSKSRILYPLPPPSSHNRINNVKQVADNSQILWIWIVCLVLVVKLLGLIIVFRLKIISVCFGKEVLDAL